MAVGPSLRQLHSHKAIHDGGHAGAVSRTADVFEALKLGDMEQTNAVLDELLDYWETRIIAHADAEESGFYEEIVQRKPELQELIIKLTRDHDLLRIITADIRQLREAEGLSPKLFQKLQALIVINEIHSRDEEQQLFDV